MIVEKIVARIGAAEETRFAVEEEQKRAVMKISQRRDECRYCRFTENEWFDFRLSLFVEFSNKVLPFRSACSPYPSDTLCTR